MRAVELEVEWVVGRGGRVRSVELSEVGKNGVCC